MGTGLQQPQDNVIFATHQLKSTNIIIAHLLAFCLPESYSMLLTILTSSDSAQISSTWVTNQVTAKKQHQITKSRSSATVADCLVCSSSGTPSTITAKIAHTNACSSAGTVRFHHGTVVPHHFSITKCPHTTCKHVGIQFQRPL